MHAALHALSLRSSTPAAEDLYAKLTVAAGVFFVVLEICYFFIAGQHLSGVIPADGSGPAIGRDFVNTWMGGRSAFSGGPGPWFDFQTYNAALRQITGQPDFPDLYWSYPPHLILFIWPLGLLPYLPAYAVWCVAGLALYLWAAWSGGADRKYALFLAVAPGVAVNVFFGQNGFLTAALLIGGLANLDRRPIVAGMLFGILTIKPQFGLLLPALLLMTGRWRVMAAAVATTAVLVAATSIWFGPDIWQDYIRKVGPQQHWLLTEGGGLLLPMVSSAFVNARLVGLPLGAAWVLQTISSAGALAMVVWTFWRRRDPVLSFALFVTATFLFSPWMLNYDMVVFGWVVALLRGRTDNTIADEGLAIAVWTLPVTMLLFGAVHIPIAMVVLPAFAGRLVWRLSHAVDAAAASGGENRGAVALSSA
ncbi:MAG: glycosyltransferase family 87 protein [Xanthobacteraceae bacterium]|jgi:alpha-1,2-mannosyltransferase